MDSKRQLHLPAGRQELADVPSGKIFAAQPNPASFYEHTAERGKWDGNNEPGVTNNTNDENGLQLNVYPNPTKQELFVSIRGIEEGEILFIMWNTIGQNVKQFTLKPGVNTINTSELSEGIYHYSIFVKGYRQLSGKQVIIK